MEEILKVQMSRELLERFFTRDADCNRLSMELGEPDEEGFYCPTITTHCDDNPLKAADQRIEALEQALQAMRAALPVKAGGTVILEVPAILTSAQAEMIRDQLRAIDMGVRCVVLVGAHARKEPTGE